MTNPNPIPPTATVQPPVYDSAGNLLPIPPMAPPIPDPPILLEARDITVIFGRLIAVNNVSLQLRAGDLLGLIGPNGAGKTTLLRAIAGLQPRVAGRLAVMGIPVTGNTRDHLRHLGFTPDTPAAYASLTVREFLQFVARGYGIHPSLCDERIDFWLEKVWLADKAKQRVRALSRGMRQRLGIARTLLPNPAVVLLDEPAAGLDPAGRVQFRELLLSLREQGKALIVSSHILADMGEYCSHTGIMSAGRMVRLGTVHELAHGTVVGRCRYTIDLAAPTADLAATLAAIDGVEHIQVDGLRATLTFDHDRAAAARLLAALVQHNVPVAAFTATAVNLETTYLQTGIAQVE